MKITFFSFEEYPYGGAAANRHIAYIEELANNFIDVTLVIINKKKSENIYFNDKFKIVYIDIKTNNKILKLLETFFKILFFLIRSVKVTNDKWFYLGTSGLLALPLFLTSRGKIPIFHERTELPSLMISNNVLSKLDYYIYKNFVMKRFKSIFVISEKLKEEISKYPNVLNENIFIANMIVDFNRFENKNNNENDLRKFNIITYCGDMSTNKDGLRTLIKAFNYAFKINQNLKLVLVGNTNTNYFINEIMPIIDKFRLNEFIIKAGFIKRDKIPEKLFEADLLVLARENDLQSKYGFPTKLGEYLATKKPVLITNVGEISKFLVNEESAYISSSDDFEMFGKKIIDIFENYSAAKLVGYNGYKVALNNFSPKLVADVLINVMRNK